MSVTRDEILREVRRTAEANGGKPLGRIAFLKSTGIKESEWSGRYWARWSEVLKDAGFGPNRMNGPIEESVLLSQYADFALSLGRLPVGMELRLRRRADETFPSHNVFSRIGKRAQFLSRLYQHCTSRSRYEVLVPMIDAALRELPSSEGGTQQDAMLEGFVYLVRMGKHYKIGKTFSVPRRHREIALELPEKLEPVHVIRTDDPTGIEAYWHKRFQAKCTNSEWFALTVDDVRAFKKRKFM